MIKSFFKLIPADRTAAIILLLAVSFFAAPLSFAKEAGTFEKDIETGKAKYVGMETCALCHEKTARDFPTSTHFKMSVADPKVEGEGCESCHGPGSLHVDGEGDKSKIMNPRKDPKTCYRCHIEKRMEFSLQYHHPVPEGRISCADCHNTHKGDAKPWPSASLESRNELCFKCHADKKGPVVFPHEALEEGCTACHNVHGSINDKLLIMRDATLCLQCHAQPDYPVVGRRNHAANMNQGTCFSGSCHTAVHGSNFDEHLRR
ncbi:MAG: cytochrome c3 family protein [Candidatus Omnitrophota bacterium]|nr:cytochrome c3 family protein [Candidatus Omnitrophota bacterium]